MSFLFMRQPPDENPQSPYAVAGRSKEFAIDNVRTAEDEVRRAQVRLHEAMEKNSSDSWDDERIVAKAEENLDDAELRLAHAVSKRRWELDDKWKQIFPRIAAAIAWTKARLFRVDWNFFRPKL